jgi:hypothetical protein
LSDNEELEDMPAIRNEEEDAEVAEEEQNAIEADDVEAPSKGQ